MITPRGRAKILDFGLAKPILRSELDPVLTGKGQLVGTSRAMSPEYVSGETVDHRSDLFSLGVLLYETLTGQSPFKSHNTLATLKQVMLHKQTPAKQLSPHAPAELSNLIDQLLEKDPGNRPQSAHEVAQAFGRLTGQLSSGLIEMPPGAASRPGGSSTLTTFTASDTVLDLRPRRRWLIAGIAIAVLVAAAFVAGLFLSSEEPEPQLPPDQRIQIVLADFQNNTDEAALGASVGEALRTALDQSRSNIVLSRSQIRDSLSRMQKPEDTTVDREIGREIALRESAERLIVGNVSKFGSSYSVIVDVVDPATDSTAYSANGTARSKDRLLDTIEQLGRDVRTHLGESAAEVERTTVSLAKVTTPNLEALKAYTLGVQRIVEVRDAEAISFLERALGLDPEFAMADAKLGVIYSFEDNEEKALHHLRRALENEDRLTEVQRFYVEGWLARWTGTAQDVVDNWALMRELYPENYSANYNLGMARSLYQGDCEGAAEAFSDAVRIGQGNELGTALVQLGYCQMAMGQIEEASDSFTRSTDPDAVWGLVDLDIAGRRFEAAQEMIDSIPSSPGTEARRLFTEALILADTGRLGEAVQKLDSMYSLPQASDRDSSLPISIELKKATLYFYLADPEKLRDSLERALQKEQELSMMARGLQGEETLVPALSAIGKLAARAGLTETAEDVERRISTMVSASSPNVWQASLLVLQAELGLIEGETEESKKRMDRSRQLCDIVQQHDTSGSLSLAVGDTEDAAIWFSRLEAK
ncbi:MAG: protein kinase, partial [Holophagales bacterium]|nr:protein kinase [Holophagales bacterium]